MTINMETALKFKLFQEMTEDLNEKETKEFLVKFSQELKESYGFDRKEINTIVNEYNEIEFTEENVYKIIDFLAYVNFIYIEKIVKYVVEEYMFKQHKFFKELSNCRVVIEFLCNTCKDYIEDETLSFNTTVELLKYYDCDDFFENEMWTLTEIDTGVYALKYNGNEENLMIPTNVEEIEFGEGFDQPIVLPDNLKKLKFDSDSSFDQDIELPEGLEELKLGLFFTKPIKLPSTLKKFFIRSDYKHNIVLPDGIEQVELHKKFNVKVTLPESVKIFRSGGLFNQPIEFHEGIEEIDMSFDNMYNPYADIEAVFNRPITIPSTVKIFKCSDHFDQPIVLPYGIEDVEIRVNFNQPFTLPSTIKKFTIYEDYRSDKHHKYWPSENSSAYTKPNDKIGAIIFPEGIEIIHYFGSGYDYPIVLPSTIKEFVDSSPYGHKIVFNEKIKTIRLSDNFKTFDEIPKNIKIKWIDFAKYDPKIT